MTKKEIQEQINKILLDVNTLKADLLLAEDEDEPFTCKGEWYTEGKATAYKGKGDSTARRKNFNYWQTKEIAEKAYQLQLRHRKMLSFVSQHQKLDVGDWYIYKTGTGWVQIETKQFFPDSAAMTKETAYLMLEAIENGSLDLS